MKLKMSNFAENEQIAGHARAQTVGGKRIPGKSRKSSGETCEPTASTVSGVELNPTWVISGAVQDQKQDFPTSAMKHMQHKPMPSKQKPHGIMQTNRIIQQPR
ncbi:Oidioi.mRNA.OKI2018_I69.PAR.g13018.t1.cds [Oikopleura dioica]|uniref:Oidioi.mRNA.OKI2018_I69.PAR.g13018.t1.cds n=1 Tax=Oikopleura dioica TaxID=34765 RepID=A0ABN7S3C7_OIKDI|nr:Oidioi.mRNA.OKI2018_I69.PAR.g13018.t1.cds [Oikopleura dioica]